VAPNGNQVTPKLDGIGYVLERRIFDYEVAKLAAREGAEIITKAYVYDLLRDGGGNTTGVRVLIKDKPAEIKSKIIIGADGVESRVGRWAGIDTACSIHDMESCAQMTMAGVELEQDCLEFYFGDAVAPGGYLWAFPKGPSAANVGIGISVEESKKKSAIRYLQEFVEKKYPDASILTQIAGGVPCAKTCDTIVKDNVMLVGDAAHQVNPVSGGGIISGMIAGMIAGEEAAKSVKSNDLSQLAEYQKRWQKRLGWRHNVFYNIKEAISNFNDDTLNSIAESSLKLTPEKQTLGSVFRAALWNQPSMLLEVAKIFVS
ncbi:MAG: NAD(P)/FAD-dependent oxidoreductase, partial [Bacteroidetes bacterium]|nr:NAD(P)/FAD-dependent oxidoreductase [Bacteroidota bacterium]